MLYFNEKLSAFDALIKNEFLLRYTNETKQNTLYVWQTPKTVILGSKDTRLTNLSCGLQFLKEQNYEYVLRNSGGLAVVSDKEVINISLIIYNHNQLTIDEAYQIMVDLITKILKPLPINKKEIKDSYCPGSFDLSINNFKIAGLSQKRFKNAINIMAYISLAGNQEKRAQLIKQFYQLSQADNSFPTINPQCMKSLCDFNYPYNTFLEKLNNNFEFTQNNNFYHFENNHQALYKQIKNSFIKKQTLLKEGD